MIDRDSMIDTSNWNHTLTDLYLQKNERIKNDWEKKQNEIEKKNGVDYLDLYKVN